MVSFPGRGRHWGRYPLIPMKNLSKSWMGGVLALFTSYDSTTSKPCFSEKRQQGLTRTDVMKYYQPNQCKIGFGEVLNLVTHFSIICFLNLGYDKHRQTHRKETNKPQNIHFLVLPGKPRKVLISLGNWIAGFRGKPNWWKFYRLELPDPPSFSSCHCGGFWTSHPGRNPWICPSGIFSGFSVIRWTHAVFNKPPEREWSNLGECFVLGWFFFDFVWFFGAKSSNKFGKIQSCLNWTAPANCWKNARLSSITIASHTWSNDCFEIT